MYMYGNLHSQPSTTEPFNGCLTKLGRDEVAHGPLQVLLFFGQIRPGVDPGRGQNR